MLKLLDNMKNQKQKDKASTYYRDLIRREAKMGGQLFGPTPHGTRREFFCLDENTWVWHEEWTDKNGQRQIVTTRYTIRPSGILKSQNSRHYEKVSDQEAERLCMAAKLYLQKIKAGMYQSA
jgi:hypothetical protein